MQAKFAKELEVTKQIHEKMKYFEGLKNISSDLTDESNELVDMAKDLQIKLDTTLYQMTVDYSDKEIEDQLGDEMFADFFALQYDEAFHSLEEECNKVIADCEDRKDKLLNAIIWG